MVYHNPARQVGNIVEPFVDDWRVGRRGRRRTSTRNIDNASHAKRAMHEAKVRITASLRKSELIDIAVVGKDSLVAVHIVERTKLPINRAGIAAGDAVAVTKPSPSDGVTDGDVYVVRIKGETALSHRHIENLAAAQRHATNRRLSVLVNNANRRCALCAVQTRPPVDRFGSYQKYDGKHHCQPKNRPRCIGIFSSSYPFFCAPAFPAFVLHRDQTAADPLRFSARDLAQELARKASRILC